MTGAENKRHTGDDNFYLGVPGRLIVSTGGKNALQAPMGR